MEEVENLWKKLSLYEEEEKGLEMPYGATLNRFLLAGKFFTHRVVNVEAVARTFKPFWRTWKGFDICDMGDNKLVFDFENENDLERVLEHKPWTYDKHLVVFQRVDESIVVSSLSFSETTFWVQVHSLPIKSMTPKVGKTLGSSLGKVVRVAESEDDRDNKRSLRLYVSIDISKFLSYGRKLWANGVQMGLASFRYERLPNFCYWCSCLSHKERDCDVWLSSRGKLSKEKQQFGLWLRAKLEKSQCKSVISVSGSGKASNRKPRAEANMIARVATKYVVSGCEAQKLPVTCYANLETDKFNEKLQDIDRELGLVVE